MRQAPQQFGQARPIAAAYLPYTVLSAQSVICCLSVGRHIIKYNRLQYITFHNSFYSSQTICWLSMLMNTASR